MIYNFIENPFLNSRLSNEDFNLFVKSHLGFLTSANTGKTYNALIAALSPVYNGFELWQEKYDKNLTNRKGKTKTVNSILNDFENFVKNEVHKEVYYKFGSNKEIYNEFFPKGLKEYNKITKKTASILFDRIEKACAKYKTDLPAEMEVTATTFNADFDQAISRQISGKGSVKDASKEGENLRTAVAKVMYENLLKLLILHINAPREVLSLYDTAYLNKTKNRKKIAVFEKKQDKAA